MDHYYRQVEGCNLPDSIKAMLRTRDPATDEEAYPEFVYMLQRAEYYNELAKIEFAIAWTAEQTDPGVIAKANARIKQLAQRLEELA